jgi:shikimate dehydrogenase
MSIKKLIDSGVISIAKQPKNNAVDIDTIGDTRLLLFPIDHDYPGGSAAMHNAVFSAFNLNNRSAFIVSDPANAEQIVNAFRSDPMYIGGGAGSGFKDKVGPFLDKLDQSAKAIGSVNVIAKEDGELVGYNTDGIGFVNGLLNEYPDCIKGKKVLILGAGGTALPICYEMSQHQPAEIIIANRTVSKAEAIAEMVSPFCAARGVGEDQIGCELADAGIVVNTSNKGAQPNEMYSAFAPMTGDPENDMAVGIENLSQLPTSSILADILLEEDTLTMSMAREHGNPTHSGRHMNLFQAVPAFKIMTKLYDCDDQDILEIMKNAT